MVFRVLPFLIIFLFVMIGNKSVDIIDSLPIFVKEINASESTDAQKEADFNESKVSGTNTEHTNAAPNAASDNPKQQTHQRPEFSPTELNILQNLAARRELLERRERDISLKEASLQVIEKNIEYKIAELKDLQVELKGIMNEYKNKEDEKITSLVKIYESMKPQDSAKIFEQLQMSILVEVADYMKEAKLGAILAKMDTYKAKELTVELANRRKVKGSN